MANPGAYRPSLSSASLARGGGVVVFAGVGGAAMRPSLSSARADYEPHKAARARTGRKARPLTQLHEALGKVNVYSVQSCPVQTGRRLPPGRARTRGPRTAPAH